MGRNRRHSPLEKECRPFYPLDVLLGFRKVGPEKLERQDADSEEAFRPLGSLREEISRHCLFGSFDKIGRRRALFSVN